MSRFIGIDLGTTNSTVSIANLTFHGDIDAKTLEINQLDETGNDLVLDTALPSVLYIDEKGNSFVGQFAKRMHSINTKQVIKESKPYMGTDAKWDINGETFYPEKVASYYLSSLKREAEKYAQEKIDSAVITIPASFDMQQQRATQKAAVLAGFAKDKIHMIPEPTAALLDYINDESKLDPTERVLRLNEGAKTLLVFDLGGGTCDISILEVEENEKKGINIKELSISQYMELGGRDFDRAVVKKLFSKYFAEINLTKEQVQEKYDKSTLAILQGCLYDFAERAKKAFSAKILGNHSVNYYENPSYFDHETFSRSLPGHLPTELVCRLSITKAEYDAAIKQLLYFELDRTKNKEKNIEKPILSALASSNRGQMTVDDIDHVFLVGGMTLFPTVRERVYELFNRRIEPLSSINPMNSVSKGAAVYHRQLDKIKTERNTGGTITESITPQSIIPNNVYIHVAEDDPVLLLKKGEVLPYTKTFSDTFIVGLTEDSIGETRQMRLEIFTAEQVHSMNPKVLKDIIVTLPKVVKDREKLVLCVNCDTERNVAIEAWLENDPEVKLNVTFAGREYTEEEMKTIQANHAQTNNLVAQ